MIQGRAERPRTYHPVQCSACGGSHLVDPTTGGIPIKSRPHVTERRFPKPWKAEETDACFIIETRTGRHWLTSTTRREPGQRSAANLLTRDEARRIAVNMAKLPDLLLKYGT
jgi:hypothetical protein